ncbi:MAG: hypothetical protein HY567_03140 [Candidatus Kerfeldbacteria bacterium]|nr:hypothetical protein [Candidatus Kerfeldbacteria bacterium]
MDYPTRLPAKIIVRNAYLRAYQLDDPLAVDEATPLGERFRMILNEVLREYGLVLGPGDAVGPSTTIGDLARMAGEFQ